MRAATRETDKVPELLELACGCGEGQEKVGKWKDRGVRQQMPLGEREAGRGWARSSISCAHGGLLQGSLGMSPPVDGEEESAM